MNGSDFTAKTAVFYGRISLGVALVLVIIFGANILSGKSFNQVFMSDVTEAIVLFSAAVFFVIGVLRLEKATKTREEISKERELSGEQEGTNRA
jgi:4-hydroxybenzoate polyprenyltransferase